MVQVPSLKVFEAGRSLEQPALAKGVPARGRGWSWTILKGPTQTVLWFRATEPRLATAACFSERGALPEPRRHRRENR